MQIHPEPGGQGSPFLDASRISGTAFCLVLQTRHVAVQSIFCIYWLARQLLGVPIWHSALTPSAKRCVGLFHTARSSTGAAAGIVPTRLHSKKCVSLTGITDVLLRARAESRIGHTIRLETFSGAEACK